MTSRRPLASVSFDADDLWSYMKTHGDPAWRDRPSYLPRCIPAALDLLDELNVRITFFLIGFDAARAENRTAMEEITRRGHEIGNHTFEHDPWLHLLSEREIDDELAKAEDAIEDATGSRPTGFRGPGFSWTPQLFDVLARRAYHYDASTLPTFIGPLARRYFLANSDLTPEQIEQREALFGSFWDGFKPNGPYRWELSDQRSLLEIPVTTIPGVRLPFHMSYLLYLARYSRRLMVLYLETALVACRVAGVEPSFLLHPLDILGGDEFPELRFFPGMDLPTSYKREIFLQALAALGRRFTLTPMGEHARAIERRGRLPTRRPSDTGRRGGTNRGATK